MDFQLSKDAFWFAKNIDLQAIACYVFSLIDIKV